MLRRYEQPHLLDAVGPTLVADLLAGEERPGDAQSIANRRKPAHVQQVLSADVWRAGKAKDEASIADLVKRICLHREQPRMARVARHDGGANLDPRRARRNQRGERNDTAVVVRLGEPDAVEA